MIGGESIWRRNTSNGTLSAGNKDIHHTELPLHLSPYHRNGKLQLAPPKRLPNTFETSHSTLAQAPSNLQPKRFHRALLEWTCWNCAVPLTPQDLPKHTFTSLRAPLGARHWPTSTSAQSTDRYNAIRTLRLASQRNRVIRVPWRVVSTLA